MDREQNRYSKSGKSRVAWLCKCDCGNECIVTTDNLTSGNTQSCGCLQKERASKAKSTHQKIETKLYGVWCAMKRRCYNQNDSNYKRYGGRGITMCDEWKNDFSLFYQWATHGGYAESAKRGQCTIDRINNDGNYCPDNCRWVSQQVQMNNVSYNHYLSFNGESHTVAEWSRITSIPYYTILNRINRYNYSVEQALSK